MLSKQGVEATMHDAASTAAKLYFIGDLRGEQLHIPPQRYLIEMTSHRNFEITAISRPPWRTAVCSPLIPRTPRRRHQKSPPPWLYKSDSDLGMKMQYTP